MNWLAKEIKEKRTGNVFHNFTTIPGTDAWEFTHLSSPAPLGVLTVRTLGKATIEILYVWTHEKYRRCGIATRMLEAVIKHNLPELKAIITGTVNEHSESWIKRLCFDQDEALGWVKRIIPSSEGGIKRSKPK